MKKSLLATLLVLSLVFFAAGCGGNTSAPEQAPADETLKLGVIQIVEHPALDAAREGFLAEMAENGFVEGEALEVVYKNAQGDMNNLQTMAQKLVGDECDLILAISTPAVISAANATEEIPIFFTAVTDPVSAGVTASLEEPGRNVSGVSGMAPIKKQMEFITDVLGDIDNLGVIFNEGEINSQVQVDIVKEVAAEAGIGNVVEKPVYASSEVMQAAQSLVGKVDAIFLPTDNTVMSAYASVINVAETEGIPLFPGEATPLDQGGVGTIGVDYFKLGEQTARMALRVLDGADITVTPVEFQENPVVSINTAGAERIGVEIPQEIIDLAENIISE